MKLVIIESPCSPKNGRTIGENLAYARKCLLDSLRRGEAPFASHLLYTQVLDENKPRDRAAGIAAGFIWHKRADLMAVYDDYGITVGMQAGIASAKMCGLPIEYRGLKKQKKRSQQR